MADTREYIRVTNPKPYVAHVEFNRPEKMNAFKDPMWDQLRSTFDKLSFDGDVRVIVLSGAGDKAFTAGLDVAAAAQEGPLAKSQSSEEVDSARRAFPIRKFILDVQDSVSSIERCHKPVICVLHGYCFGLAIDVSSATDIRIATKDAKLSVREVDVGLAADVGTLSRIPKIGCSLSWVKDICYTARVFGAQEALSQGFVSTVKETKQDAVSHALELADVIAKKSPVALQGTKHLLDYSRDHTISEGLHYTAIWNAAMLQTDDVQTAMRSGLLKQKAPNFAKL